MRTLSIALFSFVALASACKKKEEPAKREPPPAPTATTRDAGPTVDAGPTPEQRVATAMKKAEDEAAVEKARFTPEIESKAAALSTKAYKDTKEGLTAILASPHRNPENPPRDAHRHPIETLTFFGITPSSKVLELGVGEGWYTELLAPLLAAKGKLSIAAADPVGPATEMSTVYGKRADLMLAKSPGLFAKVERVKVTPPDKLDLGAPGSVDVVIAMREMHGWQRRGNFDKYVAAVHAVLKDGGTFGVEQHRAKPDAKVEDTVEKGYLPEQWVIDKVTAGGFELVEKSDINANPKDTKDYPKGVWTLPPSFTEGDKDKAKYAEIGESDRMTLKFKKVAHKPAPAAPTAPPSK